MEVNKTRHFSKAAGNLFVTSAAVSARIKLLEKQLGVELFIRHRGGIQLTGEGDRLVPLAEAMINTWARALQEVRQKPEFEARIHIGATSGLWLLSLQQKLLGLMEKEPDLVVQAEGHSSEGLNNRLVDGSLDLVVLYDPPVSSEVHSEKIGELNLVLSSTQASKSPAEVMSNRYIYVDWGDTFATFHASKFGDRVRNNLHVNLSSIALSLLESRGGGAYLPESTVSSSATLHRVEGAPSFKRSIFASYRDSCARAETVKKVVGLLRGISI